MLIPNFPILSLPLLHQGNKTNISRVIDTDKAVSTFQNGSPLPVTSPVKHEMASSAYTDSTSPTSTLTSACEDVDSGKNFVVVLVLALSFALASGCDCNLGEIPMQRKITKQAPDFAHSWGQD